MLDPAVIDMMVFCTKNPSPMFDSFALLEPFDTFWFVTITPYGKEIEPRVPDKEQVMDSFLRLSGLVGAGRMSWRYDPIFISRKYSIDYHIKQFECMAGRLRGRSVPVCWEQTSVLTIPAATAACTATRITTGSRFGGT